MSESDEVKFVEVKPNDFPITLELLEPDTKEVLWSTIIEGPGALNVPGLAKLGVTHVLPRLTYPDGEVVGPEENNPDE